MNTGKLPGISFSHLAMTQQPLHSTRSQMRNQCFYIRRCLYVCVCDSVSKCLPLISLSYICLTDMHVFSCCGRQQEWRKFRVLTCKLCSTSPRNSLMINGISNTTMAPAWHLNFVWQCCLCSIEPSGGVHLFLWMHIVPDCPWQAPLHHKLFKTTTIMLRNYYAIVWMYYYHYYLKKETFFVHFFCRHEENPSVGCLVIIHNSTESRF